VTLTVPLDEHHDLVHLAWNYVGSELAAVDSCGRIFIFQNVSSMGQMHLLRSGASDPDNELHSLVALYWLPVTPYLESVCFSCRRIILLTLLVWHRLVDNPARLFVVL
jgi:hypothetical protein